MKYLVNGKPIIHHHECSADDAGTYMSDEEVHDFAVEALMDEYRQADYNRVVRHSADFQTGADFSFEYGGMTVFAKVVYARNFDLDHSDLDVRLIRDYCDGQDIFPRLYIASAECVSAYSPDEMVRGENYVFDFHSEPLLLDNIHTEFIEELDHQTLLNKYIQLWKTKDTSIIFNYFDKSFRANRVNGFDPVVSRREYAKYVANNDGNYGLSMRLAKHKKTKELGIAADKYFVSVKTKNGRILRSNTMRRTDDIIDYNPDDELLQTHRDHIDAIAPIDYFFDEMLPLMAENAHSKKSMLFGDTRAFSYRYDAGEANINILSYYDLEDAENKLVSAYPSFRGNKVRVEVVSVLEWDNRLEATIMCMADDFEFAFYATDYFENKKYYRIGAKLDISLSALGLRVKKGIGDLYFDGELALDFLKQTGREPIYDEEGNVEPFRFTTNRLVAFLDTDSQLPDEAEFHSPRGDIAFTNILGREFYKTDIFIHRGEDITVPLYFATSQLPFAHSYETLSGWLWLSGNLILSKANIVTDELSRIGQLFRYFIDSYSFNEYDELNFLLNSLTDVSLPEGFDLDAVYVGDSEESYLHLYATRNKRLFEPKFDADGKVVNRMEDDMYLYNLVSSEVAAAIPPMSRYLRVGNTPAGIWSAFLLRQSKHLLPLIWHSLFLGRDYIFDLKDIDSIKGADCSAFRDRSVLPSLTYDSVSTGLLTATYWNDFSGLIRCTYRFEWADNSVNFHKIKEETLVSHQSYFLF